MKFTEKFEASEDLQSYQYYLVVSSSTSVTKRTMARAATASIETTGVMITKPDSGESGTVVMLGHTKVRAGGTITGGGLFSTTASATATAVTSGAWISGKAITSAASGNLFDAFIFQGGYKG